MEKSPKAKQYYRLLNTNPILSFRAYAWNLLERTPICSEVCVASEVSPKVKLWWKKYIFLCLSLFVPQARGSLDYARDDGTFFIKWIDASIMNWLCREFSLRSMNCPKGHCGWKSIYFFVCPCSYHSLGVNLSRRFFGLFKPSEWQDYAWDDGALF